MTPVAGQHGEEVYKAEVSGVGGKRVLPSRMQELDVILALVQTCEKSCFIGKDGKATILVHETYSYLE